MRRGHTGLGLWSLTSTGARSLWQVCRRSPSGSTCWSGLALSGTVLSAFPLDGTSVVRPILCFLCSWSFLSPRGLGLPPPPAPGHGPQTAVLFWSSEKKTEPQRAPEFQTPQALGTGWGSEKMGRIAPGEGRAGGSCVAELLQLSGPMLPPWEQCVAVLRMSRSEWKAGTDLSIGRCELTGQPH